MSDPADVMLPICQHEFTREVIDGELMARGLHGLKLVTYLHVIVVGRKRGLDCDLFLFRFDLRIQINKNSRMISF